VNLTLILFDLSYVPMRDFWLQGKVELYWLRAFGLDRTITLSVPILSDRPDSSPITQLYDPVKGIEANPDTQLYLDLVDELRAVTLPEGLESTPARLLLARLQQRSVELLNTNPFEAAGKSARLAQIQGRMTKRVLKEGESAQQAFETFWTVEYLTSQGVEESLGFFQQQIRPLFATNYSRPISEVGAPVDYFPLLDVPFMLIFFIEFVGRTFLISRRYSGVTWKDALFWRWYDIFLFLPAYPFLRSIPVVIRLGQADLLEVQTVRSQFSQGFVANIGSELTEVVIIQIVNQMQTSIESGDWAKALSETESRQYVNLNDINEVEEIANLIVRLVIYKVLPNIQPEVETWLQYNLDGMIQQAPGYQQLQTIPGVSDLPQQASQQLATTLAKNLYRGIVSSYEDDSGKAVTAQLVQKFSDSLAKEIREERPLGELRDLLIALLEEVKINYVEQLSQDDLEEVLAQTRQLRQQTNA
ncbi:MAG: hypothetical protein VKJ64_07540, partial [Leptolyngbyaceae bacterium]|nr:hypothetical protein [Leptolyngbyaceae bacterium]